VSKAEFRAFMTARKPENSVHLGTSADGRIALREDSCGAYSSQDTWDKTPLPAIAKCHNGKTVDQQIDDAWSALSVIPESAYDVIGIYVKVSSHTSIFLGLVLYSTLGYRSVYS